MTTTETSLTQAAVDYRFKVAFRDNLFAELDRLAENNKPNPPMPDLAAPVKAAKIRRAERNGRRTARQALRNLTRINPADIDKLAAH